MRLTFQKSVAGSQMTLPIVSALVTLVWLFFPSDSTSVDAGEYGLWTYVPATLMDGWTSRIISLAIAALSVYIVAELNNTHVLLRISSRMISSSFAFLLGILVCFHALQPALVIMFVMLLSYTFFFHMYQSLDPIPPFLTFLIISTASLLMPKLLIIVIVYWICMIYMRAFSMRSFIASIIGLILPYWILSAVAYVLGEYDLLIHYYQAFTTFQLPDYSVLTFQRLAMLAIVFIFYATGVVDFYINSFQDKTRTRIIYNVLVFHGLFVLIILFAMPQYFMVLLALLAIDSAILFGHFVALTYNRFTHLYILSLLVLSVVVATLQVLNISFALPWNH